MQERPEGREGKKNTMISYGLQRKSTRGEKGKGETFHKWEYRLSPFKEWWRGERGKGPLYQTLNFKIFTITIYRGEEEQTKPFIESPFCSNSGVKEGEAANVKTNTPCLSGWQKGKKRR